MTLPIVAVPYRRTRPGAMHRCLSSEKHGRKPKPRYPTFDLAWVAVAFHITRARILDTSRPWCEPYECPSCGWWHLRTASGDAKVRARRRVQRIHEGMRP